jgi:probable aminopeptidase NPEPL1
MTATRYVRSPAALSSVDRLIVVGSEDALAQKKVAQALPEAARSAFAALVGRTRPGLRGAIASTWLDAEGPELVVGVLPDAVSRHNTPTRAGLVWNALREAKITTGKVGIVLVCDDQEHVLAAVNAVSRTVPTLHLRREAPKVAISVCAIGRDGQDWSIPTAIKEVAEASRLAADLVDTPPTDLDPEGFAGRARRALAGIDGVKLTEIKGAKLLERGLGGIHGVGRAAVSAPRLLIAEYKPKRAARGAPHVALVGKGVTFDTGGLHLKPRGGMEGMKSDMGGAAATLGAFRALAKTGCKARVTLLLCLAENAIGPTAFKPDDVLTLHSGLRVEINNTDAEGRLLLADGVSYAARVLRADTILDAATLTGAQLVATGKMHAGIVTNDDDLEQRLVRAGRSSGDLVHPLPFAPEFYRREFDSPIADLRNSVKDRANAQSSCAAEFIHAQIADVDGVRWGHIDLAGPAFINDRGTGYGVALLVETVRQLVG